MYVCQVVGLFREEESSGLKDFWFISINIMSVRSP